MTNRFLIFAQLAVGGLVFEDSSRTVRAEGGPDEECWRQCSGLKRCTESVCSKKEGCALEWLPLDKKGQGCRFTDAYKLANAGQFVPLEMARLEEKGANLKNCHSRSFGPKCYRRQRQFLRLMRFLVKAVEQDKRSSPVGPFASQEFQERLLTTTNEFGSTFEESTLSGETDEMEMPTCFAEAKDQLVEALSGDDEDPAAQHLAAVAAVKSFQKVTCREMSAEEDATLAALLPTGPETTAEPDVEAANEIFSNMEEIMHDHPEEDDDEEDGAAISADASLVEFGVRGRRREGLLPFLFRMAPQSMPKALYLLWLAAQWNFLFLFAMSLRVFKAGLFAAAFPTSTVLCFLATGTKFFVKDLVIDGLFSGFDADEWKANAAKPLFCPKDMFEFWNHDMGMRFERPGQELFLGPAQYATAAVGAGPFRKPELRCGQAAHSMGMSLLAEAWGTGPPLCQCYSGFSADLVNSPAGMGAFVLAVRDRTKFDDPSALVYEVVTTRGLQAFSGANTWAGRKSAPITSLAGQTDCRPPLIVDQTNGLGCRCASSWTYKSKFMNGDNLFAALFGFTKRVQGCYNGMCVVDTSTCHSSVQKKQFSKPNGSKERKMLCSLAGKDRFVQPLRDGVGYDSNGIADGIPAPPAPVATVHAPVVSVHAPVHAPVLSVAQPLTAADRYESRGKDVHVGIAQPVQASVQQQKRLWVEAYRDY